MMMMMMIKEKEKNNSNNDGSNNSKKDDDDDRTTTHYYYYSWWSLGRDDDIVCDFVCGYGNDSVGDPGLAEPCADSALEVRSCRWDRGR